MTPARGPATQEPRLPLDHAGGTQGKGQAHAPRLAREALRPRPAAKGKAVSIRENTHRVAEANKGFAHFAR